MIGACLHANAPEMVDVRSPTQISEAIACCTRCPILAACRTDLDNQPAEQRPYGVVAGLVLISRKARRAA